MRDLRKAVIVSVAFFCLTQLSQATTFAPVSRTCPIGGEKFKSSEMMSNSYFGERPDGKPYSPMPVSPIPECPKNGFLLFDEDFSKPEIATLTAIVDSNEYQTMRNTETPYYRAWWLLSHSGRNNRIAEASLLLRASWETDEMPDRKRRYQAAFVSATTALVPGEAQDTRWFWLNLRASNALRELGDFDAASALLDRLDRDELLPINREERQGARRLIEGLRILVKDRSIASEPLALVPNQIAVYLCKDGRVDAAERERCSEPDMVAAVRSAVADDEELQKAALEAATAARDAAFAAQGTSRRKRKAAN